MNLGLALLALVQTEGAERALTLTQAIEEALRAQPTMVEARTAIASASADRLSAYGAFLPNVSASSGYLRSSSSRVDPITGSPLNESYSASLSASVDLFSGFRRLAEVRRSDSALRAAEVGETAERYAVIAATKQIYYDAVAARDLVAVAEARVRRAEEQLKTVVQKLQLGVATRSDSLRARLEVGNANLEWLRSRQASTSARAALARQVGSPVPVAPARGEALDRSVPALDTVALRETVRARSPSVLRAGANFRAAENAVTASRSAFWPTLSASASTSWNGPNAPFTDGAQFQDSWSVRFSLSYPLFNGFSREASVSRAHATRDVAQARLRDARLAADAQLTNALGAFQTAIASEEIAEAGVRAAEEDLRVQQERYRVGASTLLEVLTSQAALAQAQTDLVRARLDVQVALAELEALLGRTLDSETAP
ncbi:MAG: TolC family protein [Gemmatimonadota bacterium]